jgi:hypothetical protein
MQVAGLAAHPVEIEEEDEEEHWPATDEGGQATDGGGPGAIVCPTWHALLHPARETWSRYP